MPDAIEAGAVAVVIPTKDRAELLTQTLRSIREQTLPPAQLVIADDGSTDRTPELAREAGAVYLRKEGGGWGISRGRNAGLEAVTTEYVAFVDSDDLLRPRALELMRAALARQPGASFAYGRALSAERRPTGWQPTGLVGGEPDELGDPLCSLFGRNRVHASGAVARTAAVRGIGGYDPNVRFSEDHHLWIRLAQRGEPAFVDEILTIYRHHPGNAFAPTEMLADRPAFMAIADEDVRLRPCRATWLGVHLFEGVAEAVHARSPRDLGRSLRELIVSEPERGKTLAAAAQHLPRRRRLRRAGQEAWWQSPELREWLATYR